VNPLIKLAAFAAVLALAFGSAAFAGSKLDVRAAKPAPEKEMEMGGEHGKPQAVRGLAVSDRGLSLELERTTAPRGERAGLDFRIADRRGKTVRAFDLEHTKRMHVIVVRRDMTGFQHLHPAQRADGSWSVPVTLQDAGAYRVFADFSVDGTPHTLAADLSVDGPIRATPFPAVANSVEVDGLTVTKDDLGFTVTRDGRPVAIQDYLGAKGHLVALREGDLAFLHVHPDERRLQFEATFPTAGRYRLFLQFKTADGRLHTAAFTQEVTR
jgi:hypothetical protein